jgi:hypothetical protein
MQRCNGFFLSLTFKQKKMPNIIAFPAILKGNKGTHLAFSLFGETSAGNEAH